MSVTLKSVCKALTPLMWRSDDLYCTCKVKTAVPTPNDDSRGLLTVHLLLEVFND